MTYGSDRGTDIRRPGDSDLRHRPRHISLGVHDGVSRQTSVAPEIEVPSFLVPPHTKLGAFRQLEPAERLSDGRRRVGAAADEEQFAVSPVQYPTVDGLGDGVLIRDHRHVTVERLQTVFVVPADARYGRQFTPVFLASLFVERQVAGDGQRRKPNLQPFHVAASDVPARQRTAGRLVDEVVALRLLADATELRFRRVRRRIPYFQAVRRRPHSNAAVEVTRSDAFQTDVHAARLFVVVERRETDRTFFVEVRFVENEHRRRRASNDEQAAGYHRKTGVGCRIEVEADPDRTRGVELSTRIWRKDYRVVERLVSNSEKCNF